MGQPPKCERTEIVFGPKAFAAELDIQVRRLEAEGWKVQGCYCINPGCNEGSFLIVLTREVTE